MRVAVLTGGTHVHVALREGERELLRETLPAGAPGATVAAVADRVAGHRPDVLGLASFGPIDVDPASPTRGHLRATPKPGWNDFPLGPELARALGVAAWAVDTDVNAAARAEAAHGGETALAYVTVGTGVGVGWVHQGRTARAPDHPEAGHLPGDPADPFRGVCTFHGACVEGLVSGPALRARSGGDPAALSDDDPLWDWVARDLAHLVHAVMLLVPVERVILGGGVPEARPFLGGLVEARARALAGAYRRIPEGLVGPPRVTRPDLEGAFLLADEARAW
ncbi:MAG: fructokinase [Sandaracinus sp.]|nr:fructokinase [Sandaracinus sp.]